MTQLLRRRIEIVLAACTIFLLPTNLFLKYVYDGAYVHGLLVDYLLPKLYLSDIPVLLLLLLWIPSCPRYVKKLAGIFLIFAGIHLASHAGDPSALSTIWFIAKLFEIGLFGFWLVDHSTMAMQPLMRRTFFVTALFQTAIGAYQVFFGKALLGFWFFGEPLLQAVPTIAHSDIAGPLRFLAYGTTPHPNILAGIVVFFAAMSILLTQTQSRAHVKTNNIKQYVVWSVLVYIVLLLTQSLSAFIAFVFGTILFVLSISGYIHTRTHFRDYTRLASVLFYIIPVLILFIPLRIANINTSILRRQQLTSIAARMFLSRPIDGYGLNQFAHYSEDFGVVSATTRFLQPAHHIGLLWLSETGLLGVAFLCIFFIIAQQYYSIKFPHAMILLFALLPIISLDHYILTLQQGQLLFAFLMLFFMEKRIGKNTTSAREFGHLVKKGRSSTLARRHS